MRAFKNLKMLVLSTVTDDDEISEYHESLLITLSEHLSSLEHLDLSYNKDISEAIKLMKNLRHLKLKEFNYTID